MKRIGCLACAVALWAAQGCVVISGPFSEETHLKYTNERLGFVTRDLWDKTDGKERICIDAGTTTEEDLQERGVDYQVYESPFGKTYLIEKTAYEKMKNYSLRTLGTPFTLAADATICVVVATVDQLDDILFELLLGCLRPH